MEKGVEMEMVEQNEVEMVVEMVDGKMVENEEEMVEENGEDEEDVQGQLPPEVAHLPPDQAHLDCEVQQVL